MPSNKTQTIPARINREKDKNAKVDLLNSHAYELRNADTKSALSLSKKAKKISVAIKYHEGHARSLANIGFCHVQLTNYDQALAPLFEALEIYQDLNDDEGISLVYYNLGLVYIRLGDYANAVESETKSLSIRKQLNDLIGQASCLFQLGFIYGQFNDRQNALEHYKQSLKIRKLSDDKLGEAAAMTGIGGTYMKLKDFKNAAKFLFQSLEIREELKDTRGKAASLRGLSNLYFARKEYQKAEDYCLQGLAIAQSLKDYMGVTLFNMSLGKIYLKQLNFKKSEKTLLKSLKIAEKIKLNSIIYDINYCLFEVYQLLGKFENALKHHILFQQIKEEVLNTNASMKMKGQQIINQMEAAQKEAEIHRLKNVELKTAYDIIDEKNKDITSSIRYAQRIQSAILPTGNFLNTIFTDHFVLFKPKDIVSGDFYWAYEKDNLVIWTVADCTGHGVPGAFMSMIGNRLLNEIIIEKRIVNSDKILNQLRKGIIKTLAQTGEQGEARDGMDMSLYVLDRNSNQLEFSGANNPLYIVRKNISKSELAGNGLLSKIHNNDLGEIKGDKQPIGYEEGKESPFTKKVLQLQKGDLLYTFSDGYADQFGGKQNKKFTYGRFKDLLLTVKGKSMNSQKKVLAQSIDEWMGADNEQIDDICIVGIKI